MPAVREIQAERRAQMKLPALRPWDLAWTPHNQPPFEPLVNVDELVRSPRQIPRPQRRQFHLRAAFRLDLAHGGMISLSMASWNFTQSAGV